MGGSVHMDKRKLLRSQCHRWQIMDGTVRYNGSGEQSEWAESRIDL